VSRRQKIVLAAVFALVVGLFALATGTQRGGQADLGGGPAGVVGWLGKVLGDRATVAGPDLVAACPMAKDQLAIAGSCRLTVKQHRGGLRTLHIRAVDEVTVTAPAPQQDFTVTDTIRTNAELKVAVGAEGAEITVTCVSAPNCAVVLVRGD
jgi:hypothetical protein